LVSDSQEIDAPSVKTAAQLREIVGGEFAFGVDANLIEHPAEVDNSPDLGAGAPHGEIFHPPLILGLAHRLFKSRQILPLSNPTIG
jgi:hypothetical protein